MSALCISFESRPIDIDIVYIYIYTIQYYSNLYSAESPCIFLHWLDFKIIWNPYDYLWHNTELQTYMYVRQQGLAENIRWCKTAVSHKWSAYVPGTPNKSSHLKTSADFQKLYRSITQFYTLVTHSIIHKPGKFHYTISRIDKIPLLLVMANLQLRHYQKLSQTIQGSINIVSANVFLIKENAQNVFCHSSHSLSNYF